ncbi:Clavaminate synthase-like protein [Annulohypoxylon moriforme]|nr:Clavaminate synthase-like protein [Annulohypoxylon moriforme]
MAPTADVMFPTDIRSFRNPDLVEEYYSPGLRTRFQIDGLKLAESQKPQKHYADIRYEIDEDKYRARETARQQLGGLETKVPEDWPTKLEGPLVWDQSSFKDESEYIYYLTDEDKDEINRGLAYFKEQELDGEAITKATFPLPNLGIHLDQICQDVYHGRGFSIVRGLDPEAYSLEDLTIIYLGISSYVAERRGKQDQRGSMLLHVIKRNETDDQYGEDKPFHTDTVTDTLCLFTRSLAVEGGQSILASSWTVYNELAATRPDLIHVLAKPDWPFDTFSRDPPYYKRALLYNYDDKILMSFGRRLLVGHPPSDPRSPGIPGLTEAQAEALDAVHFVAKKFEIKTTMEKGDIRLVNNMAVLHRREAFRNDGDSYRHLIRLWLHNEKECWRLPRCLRVAWARVFEDEERTSFWDLEPPKKDGIIMRVAGSCD